MRFVQRADRLRLALYVTLQRDNYGTEVLAYNVTREKKSCTTALTVSVYRIVGARGQGKDGTRQFVVETQEADDGIRHGLLLDMHEVRVLLASLQPDTQLVESVLDASEPGVGPFLHLRHRLGRGSGLCGRRFLVIVFPMDQGMTRGPPFDFAQSHQVSPLEIPIPVLKLPHGRVGATMVENVAHYSIATSQSCWSMTGLGRQTNLCGSHTCSAVVQKKKYWCA